MKNSLRKVMSLALTVVMLFSLLLPVTGVMATDLPTLGLELVDDNGTAITAVYPNMKANLRIYLENVTVFTQTTFNIKLENMEFDGGTNCVFKEAWKTSSNSTTLADFKFNEAGNGFSTATDLNALFAAALTAETQTVTISGKTPMVDIPIKVTGTIGTKASAKFDISKDVYIRTGATDDYDQYVTGDTSDTAAAVNFEATITKAPLVIAKAEPRAATYSIAKTVAEGYDFNALASEITSAAGPIVVTYADGSDPDTFNYPLYHGNTDGAVLGVDVTVYALLNMNDVREINPNADVSTKFDVNVDIIDPGIVGGKKEKACTISVNVTAAEETTTITADTDKVVEVDYGISDANLKAEIAKRTDLFKVKMTDGGYTAKAITIDAVNVEVNGFSNATLGVQNNVTVKEVSGYILETSTVKVKVKPTTIKSIELEKAFAPVPKQKEANKAFPGFGDNARIKATLAADGATAYYSINEVDALPDSGYITNEAYVDVSKFDGSVKGDYSLPVKISATKIGGSDPAYIYTGSITVTVTDAAATGELALPDGAYYRIDYTDDSTAAINAATTLVNAAINDKNFVVDVLTDGTKSDKTTATLSTPEFAYDADNGKVTATFTAKLDNEDCYFMDGTEKKTSMVVDIALGEPPAITSAKFVDADGNDVTPSIVAAIANDYMTEEHYPEAIDWSKYKVEATYENPNPNADSATLTETYEYAKDGGNKKFTVEGWQDYKDCEKVGDQNVTVKISDTAKKDGGKSVTLKATITEAETFGLVRVKEDAKVSIKNGKDEDYAKEQILAADDLFEAFYTNNTWKDVTLKADTCDIDEELTDYSVAGDYEFTVGLAAGQLWYIGDDMNNIGTLTIKKKSSGGVSGGTVVGGGGISTGNRKDEPVEPDEPTDPVEPTNPTEPVAPVDPAEPTNPTIPLDGKFTDIDENHWAYGDVTNLVDRKIISGDGNGNINPDKFITREEAAKIMVAASGFDGEGTLEAIIDALEISDWAKDYVAKAIAANIFTGYADGRFAGKDNITREQFVTAVIRAFGFGAGDADAELAYTDANEITWSKEFVAKAAELNLVTGYTDGSFRPTATITRAEAFAVVSRALTLKSVLDEAVADTTADDADALPEEITEKVDDEAIEDAITSTITDAKDEALADGDEEKKDDEAANTDAPADVADEAGETAADENGDETADNADENADDAADDAADAE